MQLQKAAWHECQKYNIIYLDDFMIPIRCISAIHVERVGQTTSFWPAFQYFVSCYLMYYKNITKKKTNE